MSNTHIDTILNYWFGTLPDPHSYDKKIAAQWFAGGEETDKEIAAQFGDLVGQAGAGELDGWCETSDGALSLLILLDQFTRNIHRGTREMYQYDPKAVEIASSAVNNGLDCTVHPVKAAFFYFPFEHAEDLDLQERAVTLFRMLPRRVPEELQDLYETFVSFAVAHRDIIARFGRFPHRNKLLGRESTTAEKRFLRLDGSGF